jgi:DNA-binding LytR/AlgR family response regulator
MKIAICDDDRATIEQIEEYIEIIHDKSLEYEVFFSAEELQKYMTEGNTDFDAFILDIEMKKMSGIDFAKKLRQKNVNSLIIYITSHSQYVFDVFETITFDFVEKPLTLEKLKRILEKIKKYFEATEKKFVFSYRKNNYSVAFSNISYLEKEGRKVWIYTIDDKKYQCNMTLEEIWSQLDAEIFGMLNKSLIVNISKIEGIIGEKVALQNGKLLYVSRAYRKELKEKHLDYLRGQV